MDKSYVTMIQKRCMVCDKDYDTNELAFDMRLRNKFEMHTTMGMGICPDHTKKGYIVLIGIDPSKSTKESVFKTGEVVHIKEKVFKDIFKNPPMAGKDFCFIDQETIAQLQKMSGEVVGG